MPASANAHELFRGFSFIDPCLLEDNTTFPTSRNNESIASNFPTYVNHTPVVEEYDFVQEIGKGSFSTVYRAVHKTTKCEYAIKVRSKPFQIFSCFILINLLSFIFIFYFYLNRLLTKANGIPPRKLRFYYDMVDTHT